MDHRVRPIHNVLRRAGLVASALAVMTAARPASAEPAGPPVPPSLVQTAPAPSPDTAAPAKTPAATQATPPPASEGRALGLPPSLIKPQPSAPQETTSSHSWLETMGIGRTISALTAVVALAFLVSAGVKAAARKKGGVALALGPAGKAPSGVVHVLARYPIQRGQTLVLLKVGPRVVLTCQSRAGRFTGAAMNTLAEFTDPDEVAQIVRLTEDPTTPSATARFRAVLDHVGATPIPPQATPPAPKRVLLAESGDRAELSSAVEQIVRTTRPAATATPRPLVPPPGFRAEHPRHTESSSLDGAEQLRRRLARLRTQTPGETA